MMTQEDKDLLLKDLCMRLPYDLWIDDGYALAIHIDYSDVHFENYFNGILNGDVKPYLRYMASMTDKELEEYFSLSYPNNGIEDNPILDSEATALIDWLNSHHFDYRELISKGLALPAEDRMYNN